MFHDCVEPCDNPGSCQWCDGGLAFCVVCKEGEAGLANVCPGPKLEPDHRDVPMGPMSQEAKDNLGLA